MLAMMRERSVAASPFTKLIGAELLSCWNGEAEMSVPVRPELTQHRGTVHGGVIGAAADNVSGWAAASLLGPVVTTNYTIHFLKPAVGDNLLARAKVVQSGRRLAVAEAKVFIEAGGERILVATATVSFATIDSNRRRPADRRAEAPLAILGAARDRG